MGRNAFEKPVLIHGAVRAHLTRIGRWINLSWLVKNRVPVRGQGGWRSSFYWVMFFPDVVQTNHFGIAVIDTLHVSKQGCFLWPPEMVMKEHPETVSNSSFLLVTPRERTFQKMNVMRCILPGRLSCFWDMLCGDVEDILKAC